MQQYYKSSIVYRVNRYRQMGNSCV